MERYYVIVAQTASVNAIVVEMEHQIQRKRKVKMLMKVKYQKVLREGWNSHIKY